MGGGRFTPLQTMLQETLGYPIFQIQSSWQTVSLYLTHSKQQISSKIYDRVVVRLQPIKENGGFLSRREESTCRLHE